MRLQFAFSARQFVLARLPFGVCRRDDRIEHGLLARQAGLIGLLGLLLFAAQVVLFGLGQFLGLDLGPVAAFAAAFLLSFPGLLLLAPGDLGREGAHGRCGQRTPQDPGPDLLRYHVIFYFLRFFSQRLKNIPVHAPITPAKNKTGNGSASINYTGLSWLTSNSSSTFRVSSCKSADT